MTAQPAGAILQLHATHHCNLACAHCYSSSGPARKGALAPDLVRRLLDDAWDAGYRVLNLSGGEPLMDPGVWRTLEAARALGFQVDLVSNGTLIDARVARRLAALVDVVAISIDGPPAEHDAIRRRQGAFDLAARAIGHLTTAGVTTGIVHTARMETLGHLRWLVGWARERGVRLVQLHALEAAGRALEDLPGARPPGELETRAAMLAALLEDDGTADGLHLHTDAMPLALLADLPCPETEAPPPDAPLANHVDTLVVEPDGAVVPWVFGIDRRLALGSLHDGDLAALAAAWRPAGLAAARAHAAAVRRALLRGSEWPFVGWHAALARPVLLPLAA